MSKYRTALPQLAGNLYLTDGGLETTLIFHHGLTLPDFAAFHLLTSPAGTETIRNYFRAYARLAHDLKAGFIFESATWRANRDWAYPLGYNRATLAAVNHMAISVMEEIRLEYESEHSPMVLSGCIGPRGDGYLPTNVMSVQEARNYHQEQIDTFAPTQADMVCALTMNYPNEASGIVLAAKQAGLPVAISFTLETDGNLPDGQKLTTAISQVDDATSGYASYFMINCAHPTHFDHLFTDNDKTLTRVRGIRANASCKSHSELNNSAELDMGDPEELGEQYAALKKQLTSLNILGGCCGTDHNHVAKIARACLPLF